MRRLALLTLVASCACSSVDHQYVLRSYDAKQPEAVKRITVAGWSGPEEPSLGELLARVGADLVKLRKNYLVHDPVALKRDFGEVCGELQGVLSLRVMDLQVKGRDVTARVAAELHRCEDGRLLWRAEGEDTVASDDSDLTNLTEVYVKQMGDVASRYAAPMFALVQDLIQDLPDPILNDDEILEKIELGRFEMPQPFDNLLAFTY